MKFANVSCAALAAGFAAGAFAAPAMAQEASKDRDTVFVLGRIENGISNADGETISASSVSEEEMRTFDRTSVDEALNLIPGANGSNTGGSRNERLIFVRGFDRFQTTLSIDGVRVFLPADNRIDFGRFLTADLAEVQVSKGYVSVLNGPGGIGGAVNLVTRKPSRNFEAEVVAGFTTDSEFQKNSHSLSALVGTRQDQYYLQLSGAMTERDSWSMSGDYHPTVPALEDGGERGNSASNDWRVNFKAGWTPNDTDEYAISYLKLSGEKNAPYHVSDTASTRFWTWPYWDIESVYLLSRTQLAPNLQLRGRVYYNTFQNLLSSFDSAAQNTQTLPRAFNSYYDDTAYGANVTLEAGLWDGNTLTGAVHYRSDEHNERQLGFIRTPPTGNPSANAPYAEPWQGNEEETYSVAVEDVQKLGANVEFVAGLSYDWTSLKKATDVNVTATGTTIANSTIVFTPVNYPLKDMNGVNAQAALIWDATNSVSLHGSVSSRVRFPTLFERFSSRFGTAIPNPDIEPERATNYEFGGTWNPAPNIKLEGAVFYSDIEDALVQVPVVQPAPFGTVNQTRNAASAEYSGVELSLTASVTDYLDVGGNVTWTDRSFDQVAPVNLTTGSPPPTTGADPTNPTFEPQGVPELKGFVYMNIKPSSWFTLTPSLEFASDRWTVTSSSAINPPQFYETGEYALFNVSANWDVSPNVSLLVAANNIMDTNYVLVDGFPEEGRNMTVSLRLRN
ncbi:MAG: TonB-dependent receptor [Hyphomonadaceae bacterium]